MSEYLRMKALKDRLLLSHEKNEQLQAQLKEAEEVISKALTALTELKGNLYQRSEAIKILKREDEALNNKGK